ncbi:MAG TPA: hypothetical protein VJ861_12320 [Treponemataceae bacterium]|nr:hypothetical protein [Treponemataceae bacterium]
MIRFLRILCAIILALVLSLFLVIAGNSFDGTIISRIAGRIPFLNNFIMQTAPTFLYGKTEESTSIIKVFRYDIDFLASFSGPKGKYIALYPFKVEALLDLKDAIQNSETGITTLPQPYYRCSFDLSEESDGVFRKDFIPAYNTMRAPVLAMYQKRAVDFAVLETTANTKAKERIVERLSSLFGGEVHGWDTQFLTHHNSQFLPVGFNYYSDMSQDTQITYTPSQMLRDDLEIQTNYFGNTTASSWRFGLAGETSLSLDSFVSSFINKNKNTHLVFRYHDPIEPGKRTFVSLADTGFQYTLGLLGNSSDYYYIESNTNAGIGGETLLQSLAPFTLYLAAALDSSPSFDESPLSPKLMEDGKIWREYIKEYEIALREMKEGRFGRKFQNALATMHVKNSELASIKAQDVSLMQQCFDTYRGQFSSSETGILSFLLEDSLRSLSPTLREENEARFRTSEEISGNLAAYFYMMKNALDLSSEESDAYLEDILTSGLTINRDLLETLSSTNRNRLLTAYLKAHLDPTIPQLIEVDDNLETEVWYWYGKAAIEWKEKKTRHAIAVKLMDLGLVRGNTCICIFADPQDRSGFFTKFHALALSDLGITVYPDFGRWVLALVNPIRISWGEIEISDDLLVRGERVLFKNAEIVSTLKEIREAWLTPFYNREKAVQIIQSDILKEALTRLTRPSL